MQPLDLALFYMNIVFTTGNLGALQDLLAEDLQFDGPFFKSNNANDYINSMLEAPPVNFEYRIIKAISDKSSVCLLYQFSKPGISTIMSQVFETSKGAVKNNLPI